ncbi:MAG: PEP-CTERM sorting domain-containing protein [Anaerolineales bacterium]|nr:PEP-CTERM sorting domain-containing protein [Anaerolineales bacterium]
MRTFSKVLPFIAAFGLLLSSVAQADIYKLQSITPNSPYSTSTISYSGSLGINVSPMTVALGSFNMVNQTNPGLDFKAFCIDIFNNVNVGGTYSYNETTSPVPAWSTLTENRINYLFNNYITPFADNTPDAFQLALWEVINEGDNSVLSLTNGDFKASGGNLNAGQYSAVEGLLQDIQNNGSGPSTAEYTYTFYEGFPSSTSSRSTARVVPAQMLMSWKSKGICDAGDPDCFTTNVPEPMPLALLGIGLLAIGFVLRKAS